MANRVADYDTKPKGAGAGQFAGLDIRSFNAAEIKKYIGSLEELILKHPGPALASAFMVGVFVAWWIKRK